MTTYAYIAICPNIHKKKTWLADEETKRYHLVKIGHTTQNTGRREATYHTYNPEVYTRLMQFDTSPTTAEKNSRIKSRQEKFSAPIKPVSADSTTALYLQRCCLEGAFSKADTSAEWFYVFDDLDELLALIEKLEQDADGRDEPRRFRFPEEFTKMFDEMVHYKRDM